ncbi:MAG: flippase activity-associated protein Agl23, partial [Thermoanaerobaculia bacterium]
MSAPALSEKEAAAAPARARPGRRELIAGAILTVALLTHFVRLAERPLHHDESIHAYQSHTLARDGTWRYDPAYHGPFLYYANALVYKIFGASDFTARLLPAIFGLILIAFAIPLSRWIGKDGALVYALLVLISPHLTYFSRFIREDIYSLVFTLGTIIAFRRFLEMDRFRWLVLSSVSFALAGATKENAYMTGVLFVAFGLWAFAERIAVAPKKGEAVSETWRRTRDWIARHFLQLIAAGL